MNSTLSKIVKERLKSAMDEFLKFPREELGDPSTVSVVREIVRKRGLGRLDYADALRCRKFVAFFGYSKEVTRSELYAEAVKLPFHTWTILKKPPQNQQGSNQVQLTEEKRVELWANGKAPWMANQRAQCREKNPLPRLTGAQLTTTLLEQGKAFLATAQQLGMTMVLFQVDPQAKAWKMKMLQSSLQEIYLMPHTSAVPLSFETMIPVSDLETKSCGIENLQLEQ